MHIDGQNALLYIYIRVSNHLVDCISWIKIRSGSHGKKSDDMIVQWTRYRKIHIQKCENEEVSHIALNKTNIG